MAPSVTPATLLLRQTDDFLSFLPDVRNGVSTAIHDARVATRRMRELLPLVAAALRPSDLEDLGRVLRRATRRLGRARDLDVRLELFSTLEPAVPVSAGELGRLRNEWREKRERRVRRAIKALERLDVDVLFGELRQTLQHRPLLYGIRRHASAATPWEDVLAAQLRQRAGDVSDAIVRAGGVLFHNRLHATRVAMKKLRYSMEISTATGREDFEQELRAVRKTQELLGRLHDLDMLAGAVRDARLGAQRLLPLIDLHRRRLHERYLRRRDAVLATCAHASVAASRDRRARLARTALVASVPLAMLTMPLIKRARSA
jgi:CHAD domain-containing protein